ncbi:hypothetical protein GF324_10675 [bacterium]|nr:hypothetical protein [bacterium]
MPVKPGLPSSLNRLLRRREDAASDDPTHWIEWFSNDALRKGRLDLVRTDEETYATQVLRAETDETGALRLLADRLMPVPDFEEGEAVSLHGTLIHFEEGLIITTTFSCAPGETVEFEDGEARYLVDLRDLKVESKEYLATISEARAMEIGMIWMGDWKQAPVLQCTITKLMFDAEIEGRIHADGYAVPRASVTLEPNGPDVPIKARLHRSRNPEFTAVIEKIDAIAKAKLSSIIEEIWRLDTGMQKPPIREKKEQVGYRDQIKDHLAEAFDPHILYMGRTDAWRVRLQAHGQVMMLTSTTLDTVRERLREIQRCDLVVADAEVWGIEAERAERLLHSTQQFRDVPRLWLGKPSRALPDLRGFGAYDMIDPNEGIDAFNGRIDWALRGDSIGEGLVVLLVTENRRIRYFFGLGLAGQHRRVYYYPKKGGLLDQCRKLRPMWVLLDVDLFRRDMETVLPPVSKWCEENGAELILLARGGLSQEQALQWVMLGAKDLVVLDAAMVQAIGRLRTRIYGEGQ